MIEGYSLIKGYWSLWVGGFERGILEHCGFRWIGGWRLYAQGPTLRK